MILYQEEAGLIVGFFNNPAVWKCRIINKIVGAGIFYIIDAIL